MDVPDAGQHHDSRCVDRSTSDRQVGGDVGLLRVEELSTHFRTRDEVIRAVDGVSFSLDEGEVLGVVGESGCGKSVMAQSVLRILPEPLGRIVGGHIHYRRAAGDTVDLAGYRADDEELRALRGSEISMVFQEPMNSLHPIKTVGAQIIEAILLHQDTDKRAARERAVELIDRVGIAAPARRVDDYPGQMSGGMRQRVMIAMALSCNPRVLFADEPTTALEAIEGAVPSPYGQRRGCSFAPRCPHAEPRCFTDEPPVTATDEGHRVACWLYE